jgi:hypothetical protein
MSEAQFDEVFSNLKKVIIDIIKNKECETITGEKIYNKFYDKFGYTSPVIKQGIKLKKSDIIQLFDQNVELFKFFCSDYAEDPESGVRTIINFIVNISNNSEIERQWERYKRKINGGKKKTNKKKINKNKTKKRKWSQKYKKSINCKRPKGFSQKQYCKYGRK